MTEPKYTDEEVQAMLAAQAKDLTERMAPVPKIVTVITHMVRDDGEMQTYVAHDAEGINITIERVSDIPKKLEAAGLEIIEETPENID